MIIGKYSIDECVNRQDEDRRRGTNRYSRDRRKYRSICIILQLYRISPSYFSLSPSTVESLASSTLSLAPQWFLSEIQTIIQRFLEIKIKHSKYMHSHTQKRDREKRTLADSSTSGEGNRRSESKRATLAQRMETTESIFGAWFSDSVVLNSAMDASGKGSFWFQIPEQAREISVLSNLNAERQ